MDIKKQVFVSELKGIDEKEMTLTAAISTDTVDRMGEVLDPAGMDASNFRMNPVVLWAHDYQQPPIGKAMWVKRDGNSIISKVKFAGTAFAQEIFQLYKEGFLKAFSVGFIPKDFLEGDGKKSPRTTYTKWELLEYSAVPVPANPDAIAMALQRGILKSEEVKNFFEVEVQKIEIKPEEKNVSPIIINPALDELLAENKSLTEQIQVLDKENGGLRIRLYEALIANQKKLSEIADNYLAARTHEIIVGAIRKAQGKIN